MPIEKLPIHGDHTQYSASEADSIYAVIKAEHETYLSKFGVRLPTRASLEALWLIYLKMHQGKLVHKDAISSYVQSAVPKAGKDQQVRHLAESGWYVLNRNERIPGTDLVVPSGWHLLFSTENPKPTYLLRELKRAGRLSARDFNQMKATYDNRCATCGSQEGKPHLLEPDKRTVIHQGHMNPLKPLTPDNSIPQCETCNAIYQDDYVFDDKGRVVAVASARPVLRADAAIQREIALKLNQDI